MFYIIANHRYVHICVSHTCNINLSTISIISRLHYIFMSWKEVEGRCWLDSGKMSALWWITSTMFTALFNQYLHETLQQFSAMYLEKKTAFLMRLHDNFQPCLWQHKRVLLTRHDPILRSDYGNKTVYFWWEVWTFSNDGVETSKPKTWSFPFS